MSRSYCPPCGYVTDPSVSAYSAEWHRGHRDHHLAMFPEVDQITRDNLDQALARAEAAS